MDKIQSYIQVQEVIIAIKSYKKGFITNFYFTEERCGLLIDNNLLFYVTMEECTFILQKDHNFYHVYYISTGKDILAKSLKTLTENYLDDIFVSDIVGMKSAINDISSIFEQFGFKKYILLYRMSRTKNLHESQQLDERVEFAKQEHAEQIKSLLEQYFDPYSEQIPLIDEIQKWIEMRNILVVAKDENIIGFVIYEINGVTSYWRYWFVHPDHRDKRIGSALSRRFFHECKEAKRQQLWVIESNENAIIRHKYYGFEAEQLFDQIMIKIIK